MDYQGISLPELDSRRSQTAFVALPVAADGLSLVMLSCHAGASTRGTVHALRSTCRTHVALQNDGDALVWQLQHHQVVNGAAA